MNEAQGSELFKTIFGHFYSGLVSSPVFKQGGLIGHFWSKNSTLAYARAENCIPFDYTGDISKVVEDSGLDGLRARSGPRGEPRFLILAENFRPPFFSFLFIDMRDVSTTFEINFKFWN